jgi:predicted nucleic acid-binding protein
VNSTRGLLDTSVFIASETGRALEAHLIPDEVAASVVTLAELRAGVLAATDAQTRARRLATLETVSDLEVVPLDRDAADAWAVMRIHLAATGRRLNVNDLWIAASAASRGLPVVTRDGDFDPVEGVWGLSIIRI